MYLTTKCIVLNSLKFGETDLIVKTYTKDIGPITFMLKGVRKSKKGKFKISMFQPMSLLDIEFNYRENKNFQYLTEAKSNSGLHRIHSSILKSSIVLFVAEVLSNALKEEMNDAALFNFVEDFVIRLENTTSFANYPLFFCIELSRFMGFYPEESKDDAPFFNLQEGTFEHAQINANCRSGSEVEKLKAFLNAPHFETISMNRTTRRALLALLQNYFEIHLPGYQYPRSLDIIQELVE
jgi:DNA repair protein RecO (recombination protein O)